MFSFSHFALPDFQQDKFTEWKKRTASLSKTCTNSLSATQERRLRELESLERTCDYNADALKSWARQIGEVEEEAWEPFHVKL
jgi:hypothetical protein